MEDSQKRNKLRKAARRKISEVADKRESVLVIHYSCESFYDRPGGTSPRITSLAVRNLATGQTESFSIHQVAERDKKITVSDIDQNYDVLEKKMLQNFYDFCKQYEGYTFVHWNMRDANYGFQALEHRYKVLGGTPLLLHESRLLDLGRLLVDIFGSDYAPHPRLSELMKINSISDLGFLAGAAEAEAFGQKEYVKLHQSTLRKIDALASIFDKLSHGTLKTAASVKEIYGGYWSCLMEFLREHWIITVLGFLATILTIASFVIYLMGT